ncbi:uncharacterized protein LOC115964541 [Quercus lobata]|uniref:uncharacterized protein LOC115964541 n=1 Tax=Quercus lobata TaxID=97700 RepID=UPI0012468D23|nr:uncharacterized protein LOC115964541 [Quercus lobata]
MAIEVQKLSRDALNKPIPTIEEPDNGAPPNLNPTRWRHPLASSIPIQPEIHIQSNSAALLPSLCPFVRSFQKSQVARNKTNLLFLLVHSRSWIISLVCICLFFVSGVSDPPPQVRSTYFWR